MLPDYNTCIDRVQAYNKTGGYKRQIRQIGKSSQPLKTLKIGFTGFWNYKVALESRGKSVLDDAHLDETASKLYDFLDDWGMRQTGIAEIKQIKGILGSIRQYYDQIRSVELGHGKVRSYSKQLEAIYDGLDGITNHRDFPNGSKSYITGKSKTLLAIWGQTPGFDRFTRKNFLKWTHPPEPLYLKHLQRGEEDYNPPQFCEMIAELDEWVLKWSTNNGGRSFTSSFSHLCPSLPVGRIIDEIYNWEFEYEPLKYYLLLQRDSGQHALTLSFKQVQEVLGFNLCASAYADTSWWQNNIKKHLDKACSKAHKKGKPGWQMILPNIQYQKVDFIFS